MQNWWEGEGGAQIRCIMEDVQVAYYGDYDWLNNFEKCSFVDVFWKVDINEAVPWTINATGRKHVKLCCGSVIANAFLIIVVSFSLPAAFHWRLLPKPFNRKRSGRCYRSFPVFSPEDFWRNQGTQYISGISLHLLVTGESSQQYRDLKARRRSLFSKFIS